MIEVTRVEDTLNGGFGGLYGEVVDCDTYRLKQLNFMPEIVFDIGANVGIFSRYARTLFPDACIIAVEPDEANVHNFRRFTFDSNTVLVQAAIGVGDVYRVMGAVNGAHEAYFTKGLGYPDKDLPNAHYQLSTVCSIRLYDIILAYRAPGQRTFLKLDCEGGENSIWGDVETMNLLKKLDAISIELHYHAAHGGPIYDEMRRVTDEALASFAETHQCELDGCHFHARKKI